MNRKTKWISIILGIVIVAMAAFYFFVASVLFRGFEVPPLQNYEYEFSTPVSAVKNLKGGGITWMDSVDTYCRFESDQVMNLKNADGYQEVGIDSVPLAFFKEKFPGDSEYLNDTGNLAILLKVYSKGNLKKCLIQNKKHRVYFFRAWK